MNRKPFTRTGRNENSISKTSILLHKPIDLSHDLPQTPAMNFRSRIALAIGTLLLLCTPVRGDYRSLLETDHGGQRLVLGVPEEDVAAFLKVIIAEGQYGFEDVDVYLGPERKPLYNFVMGAPNNHWWVAHRLRADFYPEFLAERESEGYAVLSSEPFLFEDRLHFAALLSKQNPREQLRFVAKVPREGEIEFCRDYGQDDSAVWAPKRPKGIEGNSPAELPSGYTLRSIRSLPGSLMSYVSLIYEKAAPNTLEFDREMIVGRSLSSLQSVVKTNAEKRYAIADFHAALGASFPVREEYTALFAYTPVASGPLIAQPLEGIQAALAKHSGKAIEQVSAVTVPDRGTLYWLRLGP